MAEEVVHRGEDEATETAAIWIGGGEGVLFDYASEEFLGEVLGVMSAVAAAADVDVERIPVRLTEARKGVAGASGVAATCSENDGPTGCDEDWLANFR